MLTHCPLRLWVMKLWLRMSGVVLLADCAVYERWMPFNPLALVKSSCLKESGTALPVEAKDDCSLSAAFLMSVTSSSSSRALIIPTLLIKRGEQAGGAAGMSRRFQPSPGSTDTSAGLKSTRYEGLHPATRRSRPILVISEVVVFIMRRADAVQHSC